MRQERIKDRVLKRAARAWGFSDVEMETSFDPVVAMMLNALSYELEKVAHELEDSKTRVVERVLEIMFPEVTALVISLCGVSLCIGLLERMISGTTLLG